MPTYAYVCTACEHRFDIVQSFSDNSLTECPQCEGRLRKLFNAVGVVFKGSGFYSNDSRKDSRNGKGSGNSSSGGNGSGKISGAGKGAASSTAPSSGSGGSSTDSSSTSGSSSESSSSVGTTKTSTRSSPKPSSRSEGSAA